MLLVFVSKNEKETYLTKSYVKSQKNRSKVVNQTLKDVKKIEYSFKGRKRHFYRKDN